MATDMPVFHHLRLPMKVLSLRTIVIVAALSVITLVVLLGAWVWIGVTNDQYSQLARRLDSVSSLGDINTLINSGQLSTPDRPTPDGNLLRTARIGDVTVSAPGNTVLPKLPTANSMFRSRHRISRGPKVPRGAASRSRSPSQRRDRSAA